MIFSQNISEYLWNGLDWTSGIMIDTKKYDNYDSAILAVPGRSPSRFDLRFDSGEQRWIR